MKKAIAVLGVFLVSACSTPATLVRSAWTPSLNECIALKGQSRAEVEKTFGSPDGVTVQNSKIVGFYSKGNMKAQVVYVDDRVENITCMK